MAIITMVPFFYLPLDFWSQDLVDRYRLERFNGFRYRINHFMVAAICLIIAPSFVPFCFNSSLIICFELRIGEWMLLQPRSFGCRGFQRQRQRQRQRRRQRHVHLNVVRFADADADADAAATADCCSFQRRRKLTLTLTQTQGSILDCSFDWRCGYFQ